MQAGIRSQATYQQASTDALSLVQKTGEEAGRHF